MWLYCSFIYDPAGKCCLGGGRKNHRQGQRATEDLVQVLQSDYVPHNPQPTCLSQALKASTIASVMPERMVVSATGLSGMPQDGHLVNVLHPGRNHWDELSAGFSMSPAGEKSKSQGPGTVSWKSSAYFSEFQTHPNPHPSTHTIISDYISHACVYSCTRVSLAS